MLAFHVCSLRRIVREMQKVVPLECDFQREERMMRWVVKRLM